MPIDKDTLFNLYETYREFNVYADAEYTLELSDSGWVRLWCENGDDTEFDSPEEAIKVIRQMTVGFIKADMWS